MRIICSYFFLLFFYIFAQGCKSQSSRDDKRRNPAILSTNDTLIRDIPLHFQDSLSRIVLAKEEAILKIEPIGNGYKDLQIRFWIGRGYGPTDSLKLIVIKKQPNEIIGVFYTYRLIYDKNFDSVVSVGKRLDTLQPKSGWKSFFDNIQSLGIYDLPDYEKLKGYNLAGDSYGITVEIATKNKYRIYQYPEWDQYKGKFESAMKISKIVNLLKEDFEFDL